MLIKRLRIAGFKSFVEPAELRIEPGLTGVVGPNGCGKSNLLEALRWTMGEGSPKSLRGAGMEDVIFAGTATRPPRNVAEVSILAEISGPDGAEECEVVRRIERGAGSAYRIDGRDVRARDVALLFADAATGAHSPALVSQGRIGAVIAARPADRRQMLEEAAGIAGLHVRRKEAEARLRATEANLARLDELIADQATRVTTLRRQARAAERYRAVSQAIRLAEARMIFARWRDAAAAAETAATDARTADEQVAEASARDAAAATAQEAAVAAVATARAAALAARDHAAEAGHRLATGRSELAAAQRRLADLATAIARLDDERRREDDIAVDAAAALAALATELTALEAGLREAESAVPALDAALAEAERGSRDAEVTLAHARSEQAGEAAERRVALAAVEQARSRLTRAQRQVADVAAAREALAAIAPLAAARDAARQAQDAVRADAQRATAAIAWAQESERSARDARDEAEVTRAAAVAALAQLDGEAAALARAVEPAGERLLEAVTADPGFERALAAALGDDLEAPLAAWTGAAPDADDPSPPVGTLPLAARVAAPAQLARRLAQIALVEIDSGQRLAPGQRLVTRDGKLRRWDGFVSEGGGAAAAERLERRNRLAVLTAARPAALAAVEAAEAARTAIDERIGRAVAALDGARALLVAAETAAREAQRDEDRAIASLTRLEGQRADLNDRAARAVTDEEEAVADMEAAAAALAALPDGSTTAAMVSALGDAADQRRAAVARTGAARRELEAATGRLRERRAAAQAEVRGAKARAGEAARRLADMDRRAAELTRDAAAAAGEPERLAAAVTQAEEAHRRARLVAEEAAGREAAADAARAAADAARAATAAALGTAREARAGATARLEGHELRRVEMGRVAGERFECPAPLLPSRAGFNAATVRLPADEGAQHDRLLAERERIGAVNLVAETELAELEATGAGQAAERAELGEAVARLRGSIGTLNREGRQRLLAAFEAVDGHFRRLFTTLFGGGEAHLRLVDSDDPLEAGLEIMAQPPGKRLQSLTLLSGGEQALTAIALIFGLFLTNPAPICVLDEVDAPLDDANIERFCDLLDHMAADTATRYLVVTHNAVTMSRMHRLFGVTMVERGVSRLVSVDLQAAETLLAAE